MELGWSCKAGREPWECFSLEPPQENQLLWGPCIFVSFPCFVLSEGVPSAVRPCVTSCVVTRCFVLSFSLGFGLVFDFVTLFVILYLSPYYFFYLLRKQGASRGVITSLHVPQNSRGRAGVQLSPGETGLCWCSIIRCFMSIVVVVAIATLVSDSGAWCSLPARRTVLEVTLLGP